ncbi:MAG: glycosyltransferase family 92 protein [Selenomonadaceae bacterium]|nr:glycosyltransferase family 92 protein [Selenomonadaceae bacterium]
MVDKNLFLYDLAVVAIMKGEEPYVKEWLDYHLLAGVDHFYIYDNDSTPEFKKILQPYIDAGIVTYTPFSGKNRLMDAYNTAVKNYKFECRYMAFVDGDEFVLPKSKSTITEVIDEVLSGIQNAGGLSVNWIMYGSNGQEKADYTRGVIERFTRRNANTDKQVKAFTNPRKVDYLNIAHFAYFFDGFFSVNEVGGVVIGPFNDACTSDKIEMHHYHLKSREEYENRIKRGNADGLNPRNIEFFENCNKTFNETFDDGIVKYRDERQAALIPDGNIENLFPSKQINYQRLLNAISMNLFQSSILNTPPQFFAGKMETFLTCLSLSAYLKGKVIDETGVKFFEESALNSIHKSLHVGELTIADLMLLIGEMPKILTMNYPAVKNIRDSLLQIIPQMLEMLRLQGRWQDFTDLEYKLDMLKSFKID